MMTLEQFQATRRELSDLGEPLQDAALQGVPGFLYVEALYIEKTGGEMNPFSLTIGNQQWGSPNLQDLEETLYEWACNEGYCDADQPQGDDHDHE